MKKFLLGLVGVTIGTTLFRKSYLKNKKNTRYEEKRDSRGFLIWNNKKTSKGRV